MPRHASLLLTAVMALVLASTAMAVPTEDGEILLNADRLLCDGRLEITVEDSGNLGLATINVLVTSTQSPAGQSVTLSQVVGAGGTHSGFIDLTITNEPGKLPVRPADQVRVSYTDLDNGSGGFNVRVVETAIVDCLGPRISSVNFEPISTDSVRVFWVTDEPATSITQWGATTPPSNIQSDGTLELIHTMTVEGLQSCTTYSFSFGGEDDLGNIGTNDNSGQYFEYTTPERRRLTLETMDTDPGWTASGLWEYGQPQGQGGASQTNGFGGPDPAAGVNGANVYGYNLAGNYEGGLLQRQFLTTDPIDCRGAVETRLAFRRWLNHERLPYDKAGIQVSNDGRAWFTVWENGATTISDTNWVYVEYDISEWADNEQFVQIRWYVGPTDSSDDMAGWNLDEVEVFHFKDCNVPNVSLVDIILDDSALGNNNGRLDYNETLVLNMVVGNYDDFNLTNVEGVLQSFTQSVTVLDDQVSLGSVASYEEKSTAPDGFVIKARATVSDGVPVQLRALMTSDQGDFPLFLNVAPRAPFLEVTDSRITADQDGDLVIDPGETVELEVTVSNTGSSTSSDLTVTLREIANRVTFDVDTSRYGDVRPSQITLPNNPVRFTPNAGVQSGAQLTFIATISDRQGFEVSVPLIYNVSDRVCQIFDFDTNQGWDLEGDWEYGLPGGPTGCDGGPGPDVAATGNNVYGYNLDGCYSNNQAEHFLTTRTIDLRNFRNPVLTFQRFLGIESSSFDQAIVEFSDDDGQSWDALWTHSGPSFTDPDWTEVTYALPSSAEDNPTVKLRWGIGPTDSSISYIGWYIDDVEICGDPIFQSGPSPTPTPTPSPTMPSPTPTPSPTLTATPSTPTPSTPTPTPSPTMTHTPTVTPSPTPAEEPPSLLLAGYLLTDLMAGQPGALEILAVTGEGSAPIDSVRVLLGGVPVGITLANTDLNTYTSAQEITLAAPGSFLIEIEALDRDGNASAQWPYLVVGN